MPSMPKRSTWDVFCRVVDNYGDAGVALRLARQLAHEHDADVTLRIDDTARLARIAPGLDASRGDQRHDDVRIRRLDDAVADLIAPDVVVEAFGCGLPEAYVDAMQAASKPPVWIVLEYLSAERWVDEAHGLPSPHPQRPLRRWFFFPGFTSRTGGLLRERDLFVQREAFQRARDRDEPFTVSLFCYANAALPALFEAWANGDERVRCIVPETVATSEIAAFLRSDALHANERRVAGNLEIACAPFVDQAAFDRRLWSSELNVVRGEDSLVRSLWAARPCCWHIYPQRERAHVAKLEAFLDRYAESLDEATATTLRRFWIAFNEQDGAEAAGAWPALRDRLPALHDHAGRLAARLAQLPDLAGELVAFARERL
jgi:uncharacterized repeat protein (TIGR03837 family)